MDSSRPPRLSAPTLLLCTGLMTLGPGAHAAGPPVLRSGPNQTWLVELYTSEGCSSCPPADRWLGSLASDPGLFKDFVPVAFHVDYWDDLGWKDPLAQHEFSRRQGAYAAGWGRASVYTPNFVLNGGEWRGWSAGPPPASMTQTGILQANSTGDAFFEVSFQPAHASDGPFEVYAALLGCGIDSPVQAGENSGRKLHHEFSALVLRKETLSHSDAGWTARVQLKATSPLHTTRQAVAFWVTRKGQLQSIQAVGGYLD